MRQCPHPQNILPFSIPVEQSILILLFCVSAIPTPPTCSFHPHFSWLPLNFLSHYVMPVLCHSAFPLSYFCLALCSSFFPFCPLSSIRFRMYASVCAAASIWMMNSSESKGMFHFKCHPLSWNAWVQNKSKISSFNFQLITTTTHFLFVQMGVRWDTLVLVLFWVNRIYSIQPSWGWIDCGKHPLNLDDIILNIRRQQSSISWASVDARADYQWSAMDSSRGPLIERFLLGLFLCVTASHPPPLRSLTVHRSCLRHFLNPLTLFSFIIEHHSSDGSCG